MLYLHRRGNIFAFRIAIPNELRHLIGTREITKTLLTQDRGIATPAALLLAARAKQLFNNLRASMTDAKNSKPLRVDLSVKFDLEEFGLKNVVVDAEPHEQEAAQALIQTMIKSAAEARGSSKASDHQQMGTKSPSAGRHKISDAIPKWIEYNAPKAATIEIYIAAVKRFETRYPALFVETTEKTHIREHIDKMLKVDMLSGASIEKEHGAIRALFNIGISEDWIKDNPASGTKLPKTKSLSVRSYTPDECRQIFNAPVFTAGARPASGKGEAAFWIPLLLLFTGARREEICQLTTERVRVYDGVPYLAIDAVDEDEELKTELSKRAVPIHAQLLKLGFNQYLGQRIKAGGGLLFPELKPNKRGQYGAKWGDWWRFYVRNTVGIKDRRIHVAHSFRHLFISECRRLAFRDDYARAIVGHVKGTRPDSHDGYGEHNVPALAEALNRIDFRGLDLSHLWKT